MRYQYLLIDNDNTLMDFAAAERKALLDVLSAFALPADEAVCRTYHAINDAQWKALERGETTQARLRVERFRQLLHTLDRTDIDPTAMSDRYNIALGSHADLLPGAADFIRALHGRMKIALVSNGISAIQRSRLAKCPLAPLFDAVVISEEVGAAKPDPRLLFVALAQMGCTDKAQAVMMGDSATADIPAAARAGIDSIFFSPQGRHCDAATYCVTTHQEAMDILMQGEL